MSDFNRIRVQIVTLKLSLISDPVSGEFAQIVSGLRRRKKSEKWQPYSGEVSYTFISPSVDSPTLTNWKVSKAVILMFQGGSKIWKKSKML